MVYNNVSSCLLLSHLIAHLSYAGCQGSLRFVLWLCCCVIWPAPPQVDLCSASIYVQLKTQLVFIFREKNLDNYLQSLSFIGPLNFLFKLSERFSRFAAYLFFLLLLYVFLIPRRKLDLSPRLWFALTAYRKWSDAAWKFYNVLW